MEGLIDVDEKKFRLNTKKVFLTYSTHINKQVYTEFLERLEKDNIEELYIAHENADPTNPYEHSHVAINFKKRIDTSNPRYFDYIDIHPNIKYIKSVKHWKNTLNYISKEDPDCADLRGVNIPIAETVWEQNTVQDVARMAQKPSDVMGLLTLYSLKSRNIKIPEIIFHPWEQFLFDKLMETPDNRTINWLYSKKGNVGKTTFAKYMCLKYPQDFYMVVNCGGSKDFSTIIINAVNAGWNQKGIFFNLVRGDEEYNSVYKPLEQIKDGVITATKYQGMTMFLNSPHVIVFANYLPNITKLSHDRWKIYEINNKLEADELDINELYIFRKEITVNGILGLE